jgi:phytoene dehydrogenase-like protein
MEEYDAVIIGAGHNGLILGAYLAKSGQKVLVLERRNEIGGGLCTEEVTVPDFLHNTHATFHMMVDYMPAIHDLELDKYGIQFTLPPVQVAMLYKDSKSVVLYNDLGKSVKSIEKISLKDARSYEQEYNKAKEFVQELIMPLTYLPPMPPFEQVELLSKTDLGRELLELGEYSPLDYVTEHFEDERIRALMLYLICYWGLDPDITGLGFLIPLYLERATNYRILLGGSHRFTGALSKIIHHNGGKVAELCEVREIILENGEAIGVHLKEDSAYLNKKILAKKAVASSLNPIQTFTELIEKSVLSENFLKEINRWEWEEWSLFGVHLALNDPPRYIHGDTEPHVNEALRCIIGYDSVDEVMSAWRDIRNGVLPEPAGSCSCFTLFDSSMAPYNKHVGFFSQFAPYELNGGVDLWYKIKDEYMERCIEKWKTYAPNITKPNIIGKSCHSPLDIENRISTMRRGSIKHGKYIPMQMGYFRPHPEISGYRTPVKKLYVCGSSAYPGGLVLGAPGYNAANVIMEDLGVEKWWSYPEYIERARRKYGF